MDAGGIYDWLIEAGGTEDAFDQHVLASIIALGLAETRWGVDACLTDAVGLEAGELSALAAERFPAAARALGLALSGQGSAPAEDEAVLIDLLQRCATDRGALGARLARMVARRAQRPNHLWQDLGLRDRSELGVLMRRHFPVLAQRNRQDMKWKKFLYRTICRDADYGLCAAPSCAECDDFDLCFGDESGESLLARGRSGRDRNRSGIDSVVIPTR